MSPLLIFFTDCPWKVKWPNGGTPGNCDSTQEPHENDAVQPGGNTQNAKRNCQETWCHCRGRRRWRWPAVLVTWSYRWSVGNKSQARSTSYCWPLECGSSFARIVIGCTEYVKIMHIYNVYLNESFSKIFNNIKLQGEFDFSSEQIES